MRYLPLILFALCNGPGAVGAERDHSCDAALARSEAVKAELAALMRRKAKEESLPLRSVLDGNIESKRKEFREATGKDPDQEEIRRLILQSGSQQAMPQEGSAAQRGEAEGKLGYQLILEKKGLLPSNVKTAPELRLIQARNSTKLLYVNDGEWRLKDLESDQDIFLGTRLMDLAHYRHGAADLIIRGFSIKQGKWNVMEILDAETGRPVEPSVAVYEIAPELAKSNVEGRCEFHPYTASDGRMRVIFACQTPGQEWSIYDYAPGSTRARKVTKVQGTLRFYNSEDGRKVYGRNVSIGAKSEPCIVTVYEFTSGRQLARETFKYDLGIPQIGDVSVFQTRSGKPYVGMNLPGTDQIVIRNLETGDVSRYPRRQGWNRGGQFFEDSAGHLYYLRGWDRKESGQRTFAVIDVENKTEIDLKEVEGMGFGGFPKGGFDFDNLGAVAILDEMELNDPARDLFALMPIAGGSPILLWKHSSDLGRFVGAFKAHDQRTLLLFKNRIEDQKGGIGLSVFRLDGPAR